LYAEGTGRLDEGHPFVGYAARYISPDELEPLNKNVDQTSLNIYYLTPQIYSTQNLMMLMQYSS